jgi:uracil-DNA glycosylase
LNSELKQELLVLTSSLRRHVRHHRTTSVRRGASSLPLAPSALPETEKSNGAAVLADALSPPDALRALREEIGDCQRCPLGATRIKLAYGVGNPEARVMLIGEGPGYMEDRLGEPFVGPAGQLLDKILAAIGLSRQPVQPSACWVYIANIVKCHPMVDPAQPEKRGNDRPPSPEEIATCMPFLIRQIRIVRPEFIVALGATAARILLNTARGITSLRGQWFDFPVPGNDSFSVRLLPTFHPAALLRNPDLKRDAWNDAKMLHAEMEKAGHAIPPLPSAKKDK